MSKKDDSISFASNKLTIQKFKIVLVGDQNAGKSSVINRYIKNDFDKTNNPTIGIDFISKNITVHNKTIRLQLWDTAGQQRFRSLIPSYLKDCNLAIIVFDITNDSASQSLPKWVDFIRENRGVDAYIHIAGNKTDLENERQETSVNQIKAFATQQNIKYSQVSAKTGEGIQELFLEVTERLMNSVSNNSNTTAGGDPSKKISVPSSAAGSTSDSKSTASSSAGGNISLKSPATDPAQGRRMCC